MDERYFIVEQNSRYHIVYSIFGTSVGQSVLDCPTLINAKKEVSNFNTAYKKDLIAPIIERHIVPGFYNSTMDA